ncbi:MAG: right-handed parallel beta-helix repeat-containing protein [Myxococcales bacterium]|nr:right-handed parallel beta-helix repeat-containing protein [Myxococcales bacterium]
MCDLSAAPAVCVQCTPGPSGDAGACTGTTPVCDTAKTCRGCTADSECASNLCAPNGSCAAASDIAYVGGTVDANTMCTEAAPCSKLVTALGTNKPFIRVTGTTTHNADTVIDGKTVTIVGGANAKVTRTGGSTGGNVIRIDGASTVVLRGLEVSGGDGDGIEVAGGNVTVISSKLQNNKGLGLNVAGGAVTVTGTVISGNEAGGILVADNQKLVITNSFIVKNTNNSGLRISKPGAGSKIEFNTIVDNADNGTGVADTGGSSATMAPSRRATTSSSGIRVATPDVQTAGTASSRTPSSCPAPGLPMTASSSRAPMTTI